MLAYTVRCTFTDPDLARRWEAWLRDTHLADVCDAGAASASLVRLEEAGAGTVYEARYLFTDRAAFERYEAEHAPRLRAEGLALFPLELGLEYSRTVGLVVGQEG